MMMLGGVRSDHRNWNEACLSFQGNQMPMLLMRWILLLVPCTVLSGARRLCFWFFPLSSSLGLGRSVPAALLVALVGPQPCRCPMGLFSHSLFFSDASMFWIIHASRFATHAFSSFLGLLQRASGLSSIPCNANMVCAYLASHHVSQRQQGIKPTYGTHKMLYA